MPITVTPTAGLSDHINDIRMRTARIVNEEIVPNEAALWAGRRNNASDEERAQAKVLREKVQAASQGRGFVGSRTSLPSTAAWASISWPTPT